MTTIGIYDSGIGGLTTMKILQDNFANCKFYYLADNLNHPFGNKTKSELQEIVHIAMAKLKAHCDIPVLACNSASTSIDDDSVLHLAPPINKIEIVEQNNTLLLATNRTIHNLNPKKIKCAETDDLASMVETTARISIRKNTLDMSGLLPYFAKHIFQFKGVKNVILGCSHYLFCKPQISKILGDVRYIDGNDDLLKMLQNYLSTQQNHLSHEIQFDFTGQNEVKNYQKIFELLNSQK